MDELHGDVKDLNDSLARLSLLPPNWSGKAKISDWLDTLSSMQVNIVGEGRGGAILIILHHQASDNLDENQARQLSFDLESAYQDFNKILHSS